jgi:CRISPR/Cas system type I-B associated protein Csh2 (Cas7 group RAMP superfamily)
MADKIYCGNGKVIKTQYGEMMKLSFTAEDVEKLKEGLKNGWVNAVVKERREPSEKGTTHYLEIDTWEPNQDGGNPAKKAASKSTGDEVQLDSEITAEDLPF